MLLLTLPLAAFLDSVSSWGFAAIGIGLVIFVHELGHFLVAKKCGVRCEIFSLGFGPRLLGFRRGETDYRLSLVPIGGYVKMAGDHPGESLEGDEGELPSKSVGQRLAIFSAGVVMNFLFALVTLPVVLAIGVQFHSTRVGGVVPAGPAWQAGIQEGDEILKVGNHKVYDFTDVVAAIALSEPEELELEIQRGSEVFRRDVAPEYSESTGRYAIGIEPSYDALLHVDPDGPAAQAGMRQGDRVLAVNGTTVTDVIETLTLFRRNTDPEVRLEVQSSLTSRDATEPPPVRTITVLPEASEEAPLVGIEACVNQVAALRGTALRLPGFLERKDVILRMQLLEGDGSVAIEGSTLPIRTLEELEDALHVARTSSLPAALEVERGGRQVRVPIPEDLPADILDDIVLEQPPDSRRVRVLPGFPAESAGLPDDVVIEKVNGVAVKDWNEIRNAIQKTEGPVEFTYVADGDPRTVRVDSRREGHRSEFGLAPTWEMVERQYGIVEATKVGITESFYMLKNVYLTLKKMFARDVSPKNLSGILTIAVVSKSLAESGLPSLFFFLAILSLNLAFLNLLPIPILDGGHILFLLVEKIKGSPVSERVMGYSQLVGVVMVLALLLYVTYNDLLKIFYP